MPVSARSVRERNSSKSSSEALNRSMLMSGRFAQPTHLGDAEFDDLLGTLFRPAPLVAGEDVAVAVDKSCELVE